MKRITWFVAGTAVGAAGAGYAKRKVKDTVGRRAQQLAPVNVAKNAAGRVRASGRNVVGAMREGRSAMKAKEAELMAARDGDAVVRVEPGQVIVLREVHVEQGRIEAVPVVEPDGPTARDEPHEAPPPPSSLAVPVETAHPLALAGAAIEGSESSCRSLT